MNMTKHRAKRATKTELLLSKYGLKDVSCTKHTADGKQEVFDTDFIKAFDCWCMDEIFPMTKSQYENIILYVKYADSETIDDAKALYKMEELDKHIATIGEK